MQNYDQQISTTQRCIKRNVVSNPYAFLLLSAALFSASVMLTACKPSEEKSQLNLDTGVMRIEIGGHRFDVPLRYMYSYALATYGRWPSPKEEIAKVGALNISVLMPDMRPYFKEDDALWKEKGHGDKVEVSIAEFRGPVSNWKSGYKINQELVDKFISENRFYKVAPEAYGLVHYLEKTGDTYFSKQGQLEIKCDPIKPPTGLEGSWSPSCMIKSKYRPYLVLEYSYALKYLPQWKEIDDGLKAMFDRFGQSVQASQSKRTQP